ncbi:MAG: hypothetical protein HY901_22000 [Deltaproteobacteria bacterium]|nr:hypothetical protein [Deltaproteobacteria bacterium]
MITQSVKIHDRFQIELKFHYRLDDFQKTKAFDVALYFFVPASLGINGDTYGKQDFFNDVMGYIRLKTPGVGLRGIATSPQSPLHKLESALARLAHKPDGEAVGDYERQLKMTCCILKSALRDHVALLASRVGPADQSDLVEQYLVHVTEVARRFRALRSIINVPAVSKDLFSRYLFADEYLSLTVESYSFEMLEALKGLKSDLFEAYRPRLLGFVKSELEYRAASGYPSIPMESADNELLVFRKSVLKKYVESALFLTTRRKREGTYMEQVVLAVAAGLSMVFATAAAFYSQVMYGNLTLPFFMALVVSYMFKDRIKDSLRAFLNMRVRRFFFDRRLEVFNDPEETERIGLSRESVDFVQEGRLPASIWELRNRDHITEIENGSVGESILLYRKQITLLPKWFSRMQKDFPVDGLNDILRVSFSEFLQRMDDPVKRLWICQNADGYRSIEGKRVYHINLVVQYRTATSFGQGRYRIVLDKDGIKRIEPVRAERSMATVGLPESEDDFGPQAISP